MKVVECVLVADFDIDVGSSLSAQYPAQYVEQYLSVGSLAELMLPDGAHLREEDWTIFFATPRTGGGLLYVINLVRTKKVQGANRGARVKGMAIVSRHPFVHVFKPMLVLALERYFQSASDQILQMLYDTLGQANFDTIPKLSISEKQILHGGCPTVLDVIELDSCTDVSALISQPKKFTKAFDDKSKISFDGVQYHWETKLRFDGINVPIKIPFDLYPDEIGESSVSQFVNIFHTNFKAGEPSGVMLILHSILSQRRILFLGASMPASDVAKYVLAAISLCSPVLSGFSERAFPYTCLSNIERVLNVPGYIAGVTNPAFQTHDDWYDLLCDITTGRVTLSPKLNSTTAYGYTVQGPLQSGTSMSVSSLDSPISPRSGSAIIDNKEKDLINQDNEFMADVFVLVQSRAIDFEVKQKFRQYVRKFVQIAASYQYQLQRMGDTAFNSMLKRQSPGPALIKKSSQKMAFDSNNSILDLQVPKGTYGLTKDANFPKSIGPRAVFQTFDQQRRQLQIYSNRILSWKNTISYELYSQSWLNRLNDRFVGYKGGQFDRVRILNDDFLGALYNYDMLQKQGDKFAMSMSKVNGGNQDAFNSDASRMPPSNPGSSGLFFDDSDVERLVGCLSQRQDIDGSTLYKILNQLCLTLKNEAQMMHLFAMLPLNEGGLSLISEGLFHKDTLVRSKFVELLKTISQHRIGATYIQKMNIFSQAALIALEKEAQQRELLTQRRLHTHDEVTLKHLTPIVTSIDSVQYNPSYMSFSENSLHKAKSDSDASLVFDEGMDFISQYSLDEVKVMKSPSSKDVKILPKVLSADDIEKTQTLN